MSFVRKIPRWAATAGLLLVASDQFFPRTVLHAAPPPGVTYRAVLVGIADYPGTIHDLIFPAQDAAEVRNSLLASPAYWNESNITLLQDSAATKEAILAAIDEMLGSADADDVCLFYFSGHGTTLPDAAPLDELDGLDEVIAIGNNTQTDPAFITDDELEAAFAGSPTGKLIWIFDTCHSGGMFKGLGGAAPGADKGALRIKSLPGAGRPAPGDGLVEDLSRASRAPARGGRRALDLDALGWGVALSACRAEESSAESPRHQQSLFTYYLMQAFRVAAADTNSDGELSAEEIQAWILPRALAHYSQQHADIVDNYHPGELAASVPGTDSEDDAYEDNDTRVAAAALPLGTFFGLHGEDEDWYRVRAPRPGLLTAAIRFRHQDGDLDLEVYDAGGRRLGASTSATDYEQVIVAAEMGHDYCLRVFWGCNPRYTLSVQVAESAVSPKLARVRSAGGGDGGGCALGRTPASPAALVVVALLGVALLLALGWSRLPG